ncbi:MAG: hypothetical protein KJ831_08355, partial [Candidatus Eisenbacteria bacterium]|nr:hypothetical protein [Candidatus Eisenbacteria bacterium]
ATQRIGAGRYILDLAVDPETGRVWAADFDREQVLSYEPQTDEVRTWNQEGVNTLSYDPVSRILWAGAYYAETVSALTREGEESVLLSELGHIEDVDARPGIGVYYAAKEGTVGRISLTGEWDEIVVTGWPVAVQWDSLSSGLWILDRGTRQVLFAPDDGSAPDTILAGLGDPIDLGLDGEGRCWVADRAGRTLRCIREGGTDLVLDLDIIPSGVTVDTATGEVWIASVTHQTLRLVDRNGVERFRLQGSFGTKKVEGAWNPGAGPAIGRRPLDFTTRKGPILLTD